MTDPNTPTDAGAASRSQTSIVVEAALEVDRSVATCYDQLLRVDELPRFLSGIEHVERMGRSMTRWTASDEPDGRPWTVEIHDLVEDRRFAWRRVDGPRHAARVQLAALSPDRTLVNLVREYDPSQPPTGSLQGRAEEELHRFKRVVEARPRQITSRPRRVDLRCSLVGFVPPPHIVRIKLLPMGSGWTLIASTPAGAAPAVARWLETMGPTSIRIGPGLAPKVIGAHFARLPGFCDQLVSRLQLRSLVLTPDGTASLFVTGPAESVDRFVSHHQLADPTVRAREIRTAADGLTLTHRQLKVLSLAVALGYYEVPHKLTLRALGSKLNLSAGTVASTLRTAEGAIISAHIDALSEERDDEHVPEPSSAVNPWPRIVHVERRGPDWSTRRPSSQSHVEDGADVVDDTA